MKNRGMGRIAMLAMLLVLMTVFAVPTAFAASYSKVYGETRDRVRVREEASTNATIIDNIVKNACVYVTSSKTSGGNTFVQIKYRDSDGNTASGWVCQNDGKNTYVKILSADQAKKAFSVSGGDLPSKRVGTFTAAQRKASAKEAENTYIKSGMTSETVKSVQTMLKELKYYSAEITGKVGPKTETAIKDFQRKNGLTADGVAGPQTLAKLQAVYNARGGSSAASSDGSSLKLGSVSTKVRDLQQDLTTLGYYWAEMTGKFGAKTEAAVKKFQKDYGLVADGVAGTKTLNAISAAVAKKGGTPSSSSASGTVLQLDSQGTKVSELQRNLKTLGYYYAEITNHFGAKTEAAVKKFQSDHGLSPDGKAGAKTIAAVEAALEKAGVGPSTAGVSGLRLGSTGDKVLALQKDLTTLGFYYGDLTGGFGSLTQQAVRKFQQSKGLVADGIAGTTTLNAIASALRSSGSTSASGSTSLSTTLREGDKGPAVIELQTMLKSLKYYYGDITGEFGSLTRKAVRSFQDKNGLTVDGIAGPATLNKLRSQTGGTVSDSSSSGTTVTTQDSYGRLIKNNVYLRSSYSTSSAAKASLPKGTLVRISKTYVSGGERWYYVSVTQGRYTYHGYIRADMMEIVKPEDFNGSESDFGSSDQETLGMIRVTGNNVSLRYQPSTSAERVGTANKGDVFYYVDSVDGWFQTRQGYWISSQYAKVMDDDEVGDYMDSAEQNTSYKYNDTGSMVEWIQTALRALGFYSDKYTISGRFGSHTEDAVKEFQRSKGLAADGVVGPKTMEALRYDYNNIGGSSATVGYNATIYNLHWPSTYDSVFRNLGFVKGNEKATLTDIETGRSFNIHVQTAGKSHADAEPLTSNDTATLCSIYGVSTPKSIPWYRRGMVLTIGNTQFVCSLYAQPHGSQDKTNNGYEGQFCIHFRGSTINSGDGGHVPAGQDHQAIIKAAVKTLEAKKVTVNGQEVNIKVLEDYPTTTSAK